MRLLRPILKCHSNKDILFSHSRDIRVYVFKTGAVQYDIPLYFEEEKKIYPKAFALQIEIQDKMTPLFPVVSDEFVLKYKEELK